VKNNKHDGKKIDEEIKGQIILTHSAACMFRIKHLAYLLGFVSVGFSGLFN